MVKKDKKDNCQVTFRIELWVGMDMGKMSLEDALVKARAMTVTDVIDLGGLDHNDSNITVDGVWSVK